MSVRSGNIDCAIAGRVVSIRYCGAIKEKVYREAIAEIKARVEAEIDFDGPWVVCHDLRHYTGHVPEAEQYVAAFRAWRSEQGSAAEAFVIGDSLLRKSMAQLLLSRQEIEIPRHYFVTLPCAQRWLTAQLYLQPLSLTAAAPR